MRSRLAKACSALATLGALALATRFLVGEASADLENPGRDAEPRVFTSPADGVRMVVPRQWQATDQPTYPGLILWMMRNQPPAQVALTAEPFTRELYCSWPPQCRAAQESLTARFACALRTRLAAQRLRVGPTQPGPKENAAAGMPSAWFEYEDGKRFLRHAVALTADRAFSLVLSSPTAAARAAHVRSFEQMLRTLRPLTDAETAEAAETAPADAAIAEAGTGAAPTGAAPAETGTGAAPTGAAPAGTSAGVPVRSPPAPKLDPVGPCP
jgi:hypothetical protein